LKLFYLKGHKTTLFYLKFSNNRMVTKI